MTSPVLSVENLVTSFHINKRWVPVVKGVSFESQNFGACPNENIFEKTDTSFQNNKYSSTINYTQRAFVFVGFVYCWGHTAKSVNFTSFFTWLSKQKLQLDTHRLG